MVVVCLQAKIAACTVAANEDAANNKIMMQEIKLQITRDRIYYTEIRDPEKYEREETSQRRTGQTKDIF